MLYPGAEAVSSIPGMVAFAEQFMQAPESQSWEMCLLAVQVSDALGDDALLTTARARCKHLDRITPAHELCAKLIAKDYQPSLLDFEGYWGSYAAARMAEDAFLRQDIPAMEAAVMRLSVLPEHRHNVHPYTAYLLYDLLLAHLKGSFQKERLQSASAGLEPLERQRLALDFHRLRNKLTYGGKKTTTAA